MTQTILAIDYGLARVGLALGDTEAGIVGSRQTLHNSDQLLEELAKICAENDVTKILLGLPRGLDGQETEQTQISRQFAIRLDSLNLPVELRDEAGTSELAKERLGSNPTKESIDAESAAIILEEYLHA